MAQNDLKYGNNLNEGSVAKRLIIFALPFLISNIIQSLYSVADMLIVGNFSENGVVSMSGVNIGGQVTFILTNIVLGFCVGGTILIAQHIGSKNHEALSKTISTLITFLLIASVVVTVFMIFFKDASLRLIQTPEESFSEASDYLLVTVLGIIFIFAYNALSAILRGMGDSKRPLYFVLVACIVNIILDLVLVAGFQMGALGAAIATVISQAMSAILCIIYLIKHDFVFDFKPKSFKIDKKTLSNITKIGLPTAVQNAVTSISFLFITVLVNVVGGVAASAAVGCVSKFNGFAIMPAAALSSSVSTMSAQSIGANDFDRAKKACKVGMGIAIVFSVLVFVLVQCFPEEILKIFISSNDESANMLEEMLEKGVPYFRAFSLDYLIVPFVFCFNGLFMGAGHTMFTLINNMLCSIILRIPIAALLGMVLEYGMLGIGFGGPAASVGSLALILVFYFSGKWKVNKALSANRTVD